MADQPTFHCFSRLPVEVQHIIWKLSLLEPLVIRVFWRSLQEHSPLLTSTRPPSALWTCAASRRIALGHFKVIEQGIEENTCRFLPEYIFFRPSTDIVFLDVPYYGFAAIAEDLKELLKELHEEVNKIQNIAIPSRSLRHWYGGLEKFRGIKRLSLVRNADELEHGPYLCCEHFNLSIACKNWKGYRNRSTDKDWRSFIRRQHVDVLVVTDECICRRKEDDFE